MFQILYLPTTSTWTALLNWKFLVTNPVTLSALTWQVNVPFFSVVTLKINSLTNFWLAFQSMPYSFSNPAWGPDPEDPMPAICVPFIDITKEAKFNWFKRKRQFNVALIVPSWSCLLLKWSTGLEDCTVWIGRGCSQVKLPPSEKLMASVSHLINNFVSWTNKKANLVQHWFF